MLKQFNERAFLIRALVGIFLVQFATVGYQTFSCQSTAKSGQETEKVQLICNNAANAFNETGKLALTTFLALLVPSASQAGSGSHRLTTRKKKSSTDAEKPLNSDTQG